MSNISVSEFIDKIVNVPPVSFYSENTNSDINPYEAKMDFLSPEELMTIQSFFSLDKSDLLDSKQIKVFKMIKERSTTEDKDLYEYLLELSSNLGGRFKADFFAKVGGYLYTLSEKEMTGRNLDLIQKELDTYKGKDK